MLQNLNSAVETVSSAHLHRRGKKPGGVWRRLAASLAAASVLSAAAAPLSATTLERRSAAERIRQADLIFQGVVTRVEYRNSDVASPAHARLPHTFVTFDIEHVFKGGSTAGGAITLRMQGGPDGAGRVLVVGDVPLFQPGDRDILFVEKNGESICPLVGWQQGRLRIVRGGVFNDAGEELWVSPEGNFVFGERRIDTRVLPYPSVQPAEDPSEPRHPIEPPPGSARPDAAGFGAILEQLVQAADPAAGPVEPVRSTDIGESFFVDRLAPCAPPADPRAGASAAVRGQPDPREEELMKRDQAERSKSAK